MNSLVSRKQSDGQRVAACVDSGGSSGGRRGGQVLLRQRASSSRHCSASPLLCACAPVLLAFLLSLTAPAYEGALRTAAMGWRALVRYGLPPHSASRLPAWYRARWPLSLRRSLCALRHLSGAYRSRDLQCRCPCH